MAFPATFLSLQESVIDKLRLSTNSDLQAVKDWINQVYAQVCIETEYVDNVYVTSAMAAGADFFNMPSGAIRVKNIICKASSTSNYGPPLLETTQADILRLRGDNGGVTGSRGTPTRYVVYQSYIDFWPNAVGGEIFNVYAIKLPTALSANGDLPIIDEPYASKLLEYGALAEGADFLRDPQEQAYRQLFQYWMEKFRAHINRRRGGHTNQLNMAGRSQWIPGDPSIDTGR